MLEAKVLAEIIFGLTYIGIAFGFIPGLVIDRTGITVLGATAMITFGLVTPNEAVKFIDISTILLLYGLMVLSAQLRIGGFYTKVALEIVRHMKGPEFFLFQLMIVSAILSAILANDIVCLAFTPVVCVSMIKSKYNPIPFLLGLVMASNIGSAATIIGNPQNMLIGQSAMLDFGKFFLWCTPPSVLALLISYVILVLIYRKRWTSDVVGNINLDNNPWPEFNLHHSIKGIFFTAVLIIMFFTSVPREITAIVVAGILLCSRHITTRQLLGLVDWHLIVLFSGLFIIVGVISKYGIPKEIVLYLNIMGFDINDPFILTPITVLLSNIFSNVPAVMLLLQNISFQNTENLYLLSLVSTYSGNLITIGSIANLITIEQASQFGIKITFKEYAKAGVPITLISVLVAVFWIQVLK